MTKRPRSEHMRDMASLREREAVEYPLMFFLRETIRVASVMALLLAIASVVTPSAFDFNAGDQLRFISLFGFMAGAVNLAMARWRQRSVQQGDLP